MVLYSKNPCVPCANLKMWLKMKNVKYEEVPMDDELTAKFRDMGFMGAPVVEIDGAFHAGNNISYIKETLERSGIYEQGAMANA